MNELKMTYVGCGLVTDENGENVSFLIDPEDALSFVKKQMVFSETSQNLLPISIKLPPVTVSCLDNNSKVLGMTKSDLHRKALEIGLNEITKAYCDLTNQETFIME